MNLSHGRSLDGISITKQQNESYSQELCLYLHKHFYRLSSLSFTTMADGVVACAGLDPPSGLLAGRTVTGLSTPAGVLQTVVHILARMEVLTQHIACGK